MKTLVSLAKCEKYNKAEITVAVDKCLESLGGWEAFIVKGERVLLKPNLLKAASPLQAIVTHPLLMEVLCRRILDLGAQPFIGDSPPLGNLAKVLLKSGYEPFMKNLGVKSIPFSKKVNCEFENGLFKRIDLASEVFDFDKIINVAKCKTHTQMGLTLAVKNLFGTVISTDKAAWHMRAGRDFDTFATVLVQIYQKVAPVFSMIDAVLGMEGDGPNSGDPRELGFLAASRDAVALDAVVCNMLGFDVQNLRTCAIGHEMGVGAADLKDIKVAGDTLKGFPLRDFRGPRSKTMTWNMTKWNPVRRFMENHIITKPDIDQNACKNCGICINHCPPRAIYEKSGSVIIDRRKCISCFCCHELCSNNAVQISQPFFGRLLGKLSRK